MEKYKSLSYTPLKFHKIFRFIILPVITLYAAIRLFYIIKIIDVMDFADYLPVIIYYGANIILPVLCFIGFFSMRPYAWYSTIVFLLFNPVYNIFIMFLYYPYIIKTTVFELLITLQFAVLTIIYYTKRKPLFFNNLTENDNLYTQNYTSMPKKAEQALYSH